MQVITSLMILQNNNWQEYRFPREEFILMYFDAREGQTRLSMYEHLPDVI